MTSALLIVHIVITLGMVGIILLQKNEGGGLGTGSGTMGGLMTTRGTANLLTHTTAFFATLFFVSTLSLAILFKGDNRSKSILDVPETETTQSTPQSPPSHPVHPAIEKQAPLSSENESPSAKKMPSTLTPPNNSAEKVENKRSSASVETAKSSSASNSASTKKVNN